MIELNFEKLFNYKTVYKSHLKGRLSKRKKRSIVRYEISLLEKVDMLYQKIHSGKYKVARYHSFAIFEPKQREIQTLHYSDRIVQHAICDNIIAPYFTDKAIADNGVCQIGKGTHYTLERFEKMMHKFIRKNGQNGYVLKCDIHKYFPSVPHEQLKKAVLPHFKDKRLQSFIEMIIESYHTHPDYLRKYGIKPLCEVTPHPYNRNMFVTCRGIPIGNQTSQIFGMYFLDKVDRFIKEKLRIKIYSRYMDDFIIVHKDKKFLQKALQQIRALVEELGLTLNSKTQIFPIKNGLVYLGFSYQVSKTGKLIKKVSKKTVKRFKARARLITIKKPPMLVAFFK